MKLGNSFGAVEVKEFKGFKNVDRSGQIMKVLAVEDTTSKAGKPMLVIHADIAEGEFEGSCSKFPLRTYMTYGDQASMGRLKAFFNTIMGENDGMFPDKAEIYKTGDFDEQRLIGCEVGADLDYGDRGYLEVRWFTTKERARANDRVITKPEQKKTTDYSAAREANADGQEWNFN